MFSTYNNLSIKAWDDIESVIERFEAEWIETGPANINDFVDPTDPNNQVVLTELIRSDLEFTWQQGRTIDLADYLDRYPILRQWEDARQSIAFEEYRQKYQHGLSVNPDEFQTRYNINTAAWPIWIPQSRSASQLKETNGKGDSPKLASGFPRVGANMLGFDIVAELGRGAYGRVYLARQGDLANRFVALKLTQEETDESQKLARLQHSNIVPVYSIHKLGELNAICMPFLGVITLRDVITSCKRQAGEQGIEHDLISTMAAKRASTLVESARKNSANPEELQQIATENGETRFQAFESFGRQEIAAWLAAHVASGLTYAHQHGIVHGDLKPENILLSDDGQPLILDFHLSRPADGHGIQQSLVGGTLPYLSEKHLRAIQGFGVVSEQCDIYSLGVLLFELLCGKRPFPEYECDADEMVEKMIADRRQVPSLREHLHNVNPDIRSIVEKCLAPDPADRYVSAEQLETDLRRHLSHQPPKYASSRSIPERTRKWLRRNPHMKQTSTIVSGVAILLLIAASLLWIRSTQLQRLRAIDASQEFTRDLAYARLPLTSPSQLEEPIRNAVSKATALLADQNATDTKLWHHSLLRSSLPAEMQLDQLENVGHLYFWLADASLGLSTRNPNPQSGKELVEQARNFNQQAITLLGTDRQGLNLQAALIAHRLGDQKQVNELLSLASNANVVDELDQVMTAGFHYGQGDVKRCIDLLEPVVAKDPLDYSTWLLLGNARASLKQNSEAAACYSICIALDPQSSLAFAQRGIVSLELRQFEDANQDFTKAHELDPSDSAVLANRGLSLQNVGQFEQAEADFSKAIEMGSTQTRLYFLRSRLRKHLGKSAQAAEDRRIGLDLQPTDDISWITRGVEYLRDGNLEMAMNDFESALKLNRRSTNALQNIASLQSERLGKTKDAIETMTEIIELRPADAKAIATRGVLHARMGNRKAALADASSALAIRQDADTLYRVSGIYSLTSTDVNADAARAEQLLARATWLKPELVHRYIDNDPDLKPLQQRRNFREIRSLLTQLLAAQSSETGKK